MTDRFLFTDSDWDFKLIDNTMNVLGEFADELKLDIYPNQIEIVSSEQMLDAYASTGLPIMYKHWSFGKAFSHEYDLYKQGKRGLAYELVLNLNPCINYLMEENTAMTQVLVLAHAAYGHNHFFKNNYLFKMWTDASSMIDYLNFAKNYIQECEERYGSQEVEKTIDSAHALRDHGIDRYLRPKKISLVEEKERQKEREEYLQQQVNELWDSTIKKKKSKQQDTKIFPKQPEENILYFLEKHSPILEPWQREILRIVRKIAQYFYPQRLTKVMNEGFASFTHHYLINRLFDENYLTQGAMLEFLALHTNVVFQPSFDSKYYSGLNPYYLGFEIFSDIKRIAENPDEEDRIWFPDIACTDWKQQILDAAANYRDESFIRQFLGPKVIKKMRLFDLRDLRDNENLVVENIHNDQGMREIRSKLADRYEYDEYVPKLEITKADIKNDRTLTLMYQAKNNRRLSKDTHKVIKHLQRLWGYPVVIVDEQHQLLFHSNLPNLFDHSTTIVI